MTGCHVFAADFIRSTTKDVTAASQFSRQKKFNVYRTAGNELYTR